MFDEGVARGVAVPRMSAAVLRDVTALAYGSHAGRVSARRLAFGPRQRASQQLVQYLRGGFHLLIIPKIAGIQAHAAEHK